MKYLDDLNKHDKDFMSAPHNYKIPTTTEKPKKNEPSPSVDLPAVLNVETPKKLIQFDLNATYTGSMFSKTSKKDSEHKTSQ